MKDLSNIANEYRMNHHGTKNDITKCVEQLRNEYKCTVDISVDSDETFSGLFVQDEQMRRIFSTYPETLFLDVTNC